MLRKLTAAVSVLILAGAGMTLLRAPLDSQQVNGRIVVATGVQGTGSSTNNDIPTMAGTAGNALQDPASCTLTSTIEQCPSALVMRWSTDTGLSRDSAGVVDVGTGAAANKVGSMNMATLTASTAVNGAAFQTATNCASSGGTCGSAASGSVSIAAAASTVTVATTAVTANSVIILARDDTLGTKLSVTCNTATAAGDIKPSTRTASTSFVITVQNAPAVNPLCLNYWIVN